jgi:hypothetical protein
MCEISGVKKKLQNRRDPKNPGKLLKPQPSSTQNFLSIKTNK